MTKYLIRAGTNVGVRCYFYNTRHTWLQRVTENDVILEPISHDPYLVLSSAGGYINVHYFDIPPTTWDPVHREADWPIGTYDIDRIAVDVENLVYHNSEY